MILKIKATNSDKQILIDEDKYWAVCGFGWGVNRNGYVSAMHYDPNRTGRKQREIKIHRLLLQVDDPDLYIDHINGDRLDNRLCNIRICNPKQSACNRRKPATRPMQSKHKGLYFNKRVGKWSARLGVNGKKVNIGYFADETEAAKAYNEACLEMHGEFANLNKI